MDMLLIAQLLTTAIDWRQTRQIAAEPGIHWENNPALDKHPTAGAVNRHFLLGEALTLGAAYVVFPKYKTEILGASTLLETTMIVRNNSLNLKVTF